MSDTKDVAKVTPTNDDYLGIQSLEDAMELATRLHGDVQEASETIGDGFTLIDDKKVLIGVPLVLIEWNFNDGDFGDFVSVRAVTRVEGVTKKLIFNDGSTGIRDQLAEYTRKNDGRQGGLIVRKGLRVSEYDTDSEGMPTSDKALAVGKGKTYYLDTSA